MTSRLAALRARDAEHRSRGATELAAQRLRADRDLAAAVWSRAHSEHWLRDTASDELITVWANARAWAPHDPRAADAVTALGDHLTGAGVDVTAAGAGAMIDKWDPEACAALPGVLGPGITPFADAADPTAATVPESDRDALLRRTADALRAEWSDDTAAAVIADSAFPALANTLNRLTRDGHDLHTLIRSIGETGLSDPHIRHPAAFASWRLNGNAAAPAVRTAREGYTRPIPEALADTGRRAGPARAVSRSSRTRAPTMSRDTPHHRDR